jgi:RND family efflux transporter MFP subunit
MTRGSGLRLFLAGCVALAPWGLGAQGRAETATVAAAGDDRTVTLPGELLPFEAVGLVARVAGYVDTIAVDRGSEVRRGQVLATLIAPELAAQVAEARARVESAAASRVVAEADQSSATLTHERLLAASATAGAVAGVELRRAEDAVRAAGARVDAAGRAVEAARAALDAVTALEGYLRVTAPFAGRVTERLVHPGALVGPATGPLVRLEQVSKLRLVVPVPEQYAASATRGRQLQFKVPAHGARAFTGTVARVAGALDQRTRTMAVELDVENAEAALAPGMFPQVTWPVTPPAGAVLVPASAIVTTTERIFVIRVRQGRAEWVTVRKLATRGDLAEVAGDLRVGETVLRRGSDEIREGSPVP